MTRAPLIVVVQTGQAQSCSHETELAVAERKMFDAIAALLNAAAEQEPDSGDDRSLT